MLNRLRAAFTVGLLGLGTLAASPTLAQTIAGVSPTNVAADGSTEVTVTGTGFFAGTTEVLIGSKPLADLRVEDQRTLQGKAPALDSRETVGPRDVTVRNTRTGRSDTLKGGVTYYTPVEMASLTPFEFSYLGKTPFEIKGQGFTRDTAVVIGTLRLVQGEMLKLVSATTLEGIALPHSPTTEPLKFQVVDPVGGQATLRDGVSYLGPLAISEVRPDRLALGERPELVLLGVGFTPETVVEIGGVKVPRNETTYLNARSLLARAPELPAGARDVKVVDVSAAGQVLDVLRGAITYVEEEPQFRLSFETPHLVGFETQVFVRLEELHNLGPGTEGYSLSLVFEGDCKIVGATTDGTVGAPLSSGGLLQPTHHFQVTHVGTNTGENGVGHGTIFSLNTLVVLDPAQSPHRLLKLHLQPAEFRCDPCRLKFEQGLQFEYEPGVFTSPFENTIIYSGLGYAPELGPPLEFSACGCFPSEPTPGWTPFILGDLTSPGTYRPRDDVPHGYEICGELHGYADPGVQAPDHVRILTHQVLPVQLRRRRHG